MHTDYFNKENKQVPSVTTILKILNKDGLVEWSNMLGKRGLDYKTTLEQYAVRGTKIHNDVESILSTGEPLPRQFHTKDDEEILTVVNKFKASLDEIKFSNVRTEVSYSCDTYGGTLDLITEISINGTPLILLGDFKTSKKIYPSQFIQLGGYLNLIKENDFPLYNRIDICGIINLKKDAITLQWLTKEQCEAKFTSLFLSLVDVYYKLQDIENITYTVNKY